MARHKRNVSDLPYAASPLSCVAFFVKEQKGRIEIGSGKGDASGSPFVAAMITGYGNKPRSSCSVLPLCAVIGTFLQIAF